MAPPGAELRALIPSSPTTGKMNRERLIQEEASRLDTERNGPESKRFVNLKTVT